MRSTILVPLDGSSLAAHALPIAERLAQATGGRVLSVHIDKAGRRGSVAAGILQQARSNCAGLIVMATHARTAPGRLIYGSVADEVLRNAELPVILVAPDVATTPAPRGSIIVPLDGSELAESALMPALELGRDLGAAIVLLDVIPFPPYALYGDPGLYVNAYDIDATLDEAKQYLRRIAGNVRAEGLTVRMRTEVGQPADVIVEVARQEGAELIAMATHGRGGVSRAILGSVSTATLQHARVPVMLVHPRAPAAVHTPAEAEPALAGSAAR